MSSTYSTSLRIELMGTGDQSGTWGTTTNTNLGTLLEQAITGVLSVAQGDVANMTLTTVNGGSDQARNAVVELTGALTQARNVVVPTVNKLYLIKNSTSGGFALTVKTSGGTGVSIANGTSQWVYCDGTNVVQGLTGTMATQAASAVAITGGTIAGLTTLTMASGAATPATNDAAALGTTTLMWSDLFLASGGVINWNNGDVTITHSANTLAFAGASSGYTFDAALSIGTGNALTVGTVELGAASDTTISRGAAGFIAVEGKRVPSPASQASGDILYRGATEWERLAKGTAAQVLAMNAGATAPEWAAASSGLAAATQAEMETASSTAVATTPGRQQFHPGHPKFWGLAAANGSSLTSSYNVTSITDGGTGDITFTIATDFSSANWCAVMGANGVIGSDLGSSSRYVFLGTKAAGTIQLLCEDGTAAAADPNSPWQIAGFGDQ